MSEINYKVGVDVVLTGPGFAYQVHREEDLSLDENILWDFFFHPSATGDVHPALRADRGPPCSGQTFLAILENLFISLN